MHTCMYTVYISCTKHKTTFSNVKINCPQINCSGGGDCLQGMKLGTPNNKQLLIPRGTIQTYALVLEFTLNSADNYRS